MYDIAEGVIEVMLHGSGDGYHLSTPEDTKSIFDLVAMFPETSTVMIPERRGERFGTVKLESRARTELGWASTYSLKDYIEHECKKS